MSGWEWRTATFEFIYIQSLYPVVVYTYIQSWASRSKKWSCLNLNPPFTLLHLQNNLCSLIHPISTTKINLLLFRILLTVEEQNRESKWQNQSAENEYYIFHIVHFISCNPCNVPSVKTNNLLSFPFTSYTTLLFIFINYRWLAAGGVISITPKKKKPSHEFSGSPTSASPGFGR